MVRIGEQAACTATSEVGWSETLYGGQGAHRHEGRSWHLTVRGREHSSAGSGGRASSKETKTHPASARNRASIALADCSTYLARRARNSCLRRSYTSFQHHVNVP